MLPSWMKNVQSADMGSIAASALSARVRINIKEQG